MTNAAGQTGLYFPYNQVFGMVEGNKQLPESEFIEIHKELKHPFIVDFKHFFEDKENIYILMELCESFSLQALIDSRRQIAEENGAKHGF